MTRAGVTAAGDNDAQLSQYWKEAQESGVVSCTEGFHALVPVLLERMQHFFKKSWVWQAIGRLPGHSERKTT